jgi:Ca-activated chloride channel family protein
MRKSMLIGSSIAACAVIVIGYSNMQNENSIYLPNAPVKPIDQTTVLIEPTSSVTQPALGDNSTIEIDPADIDVKETLANKDNLAKPAIPMQQLIRTEGKGMMKPTGAPQPSVLIEREVSDSAISRHVKSKKLEMIGGSTASMNFAAADVYMPQEQQYVGRDKFKHSETNPIKLVSEEPVSTFSIDVDTASYAFMRRELNAGRLPQKDAIRIEELVNYFDYNYELPETKDEPFKPTVNVFPCPWNDGNKIVHIGIKGYDIKPEQAPKSNLVFLLDVSGSMSSADKLPLLKNSFKMLVENLDEESTVSIVVYAGAAGTVLEPTKVKEKAKILSALERLNAGGSTAGGEGIRQAYALAEANYDKDSVNRVILATDGDFNVGIYNPEELKGFVERKRKTGIYLSVLGFGQGNYNDHLMQELAQNGNGNASYIDNLNEARKVLVDEATSTLFPIANDVKIQVEFNPAAVTEYRLIGYETRMLNREDFNNDKVDAGDIGAGHSVTALYEITPTESKAKLIDDLRYGEPTPTKLEEIKTSEYGFLKMRYKTPGNKTSKLITTPISMDKEYSSVEAAPNEARFATSVAAFAQLVRGDEYTSDYSYDNVITLAKGATGEDEFGYRHEFLNLVRLAKSSADLQNTNIPAIQPSIDGAIH